MKSWFLAVLFINIFLASCTEEEVQNHKDLEQNMMDLKLYQENMGDNIEANNLPDAAWLADGTDSILRLLSKKFKEHPKLEKPFSYYYKKDMQKPMQEIKEAIDENDTAKAVKNYRILVKNCNSCHIDHEIDKEVRF